MTTIRDDAICRAGDLVLVDFSPVRGTEQDGIRPALVVSASAMNAVTKRVIVCPITRNLDPWPTKVFLPAGLGADGAVLTDQVRSIDRRERVLRRMGSVPEETLIAVRDRLAALLGLETE